jgi:hypothetical protein
MAAGRSAATAVLNGAATVPAPYITNMTVHSYNGTPEPIGSGAPTSGSYDFSDVSYRIVNQGSPAQELWVSGSDGTDQWTMMFRGPNDCSNPLPFERVSTHSGLLRVRRGDFNRFDRQHRRRQRLGQRSIVAQQTHRRRSPHSRPTRLLDGRHGQRDFRLRRRWVPRIYRKFATRQADRGHGVDAGRRRLLAPRFRWWDLQFR